MAPLLSIWFDGFFDGFTGAGLFGPLSRPGAPTEFLDSRSVEEFESSGEFDIIANRFTVANRTHRESPPNAPAPQTHRRPPAAASKSFDIAYARQMRERR